MPLLFSGERYLMFIFSVMTLKRSLGREVISSVFPCHHGNFFMASELCEDQRSNQPLVTLRRHWPSGLLTLENRKPDGMVQPMSSSSLHRDLLSSCLRTGWILLNFNYLWVLPFLASVGRCPCFLR